MTTDSPTETMAVSRTIAAPASAVFEILTDPARHQDTEPTDWVRDSLESERLTEVGQVFDVNMFHEHVGGHYVMRNQVIALEPNRVIAWKPGHDDGGELQFGGWTWRYDLAPSADDPDRTDVTLTYDWSAAPQVVRDEIGGLPPFGPNYLDKSLAALATAVEDQATN